MMEAKGLNKKNEKLLGKKLSNSVDITTNQYWLIYNNSWFSNN